jgi:hypothetical protein
MFPHLLLVALFADAAHSLSLISKLHPEDIIPDANFGTSVGTNGDFIAVGAQNNNNDTGTLFLYAVHPSSTELLSEINPLDLDVGSNFGCALQIVGNTLVVGAQYDLNNSGSVYVYALDSVAKAAKLVIKLSMPSMGPIFFGSSVALSEDGSMIAIGAAAGAQNGFVFVYQQSSSSWALVRTISSADLPAGINFGQSVAITSTGVAVGANHMFNLTGAVIFYPHSGMPSITVRPSGLPAAAYFGSSLAAVSDNTHTTTIAAAAPWDGPGHTFLFSIAPAASEAQLVAMLSPSTVDPVAFGSALCLNTTTLMVGAWMDGPGSVSVYRLGAHVEFVTTVRPSEGADLFFGSAIAFTSGVAVFGADGDQDNSGSAFLYST